MGIIWGWRDCALNKYGLYKRIQVDYFLLFANGDWKRREPTRIGEKLLSEGMRYKTVWCFWRKCWNKSPSLDEVRNILLIRVDWRKYMRSRLCIRLGFSSPPYGAWYFLDIIWWLFCCYIRRLTQLQGVIFFNTYDTSTFHATGLHYRTRKR